jgi:septum formation protein
LPCGISFKLKAERFMARGIMEEPGWILASASPRRKEILQQLGVRFQIDPSNAPEPPRNPRENPSRYALRVAGLKATEVASRHPSGLILAADTIVVCQNTVLGKPRDREDARHMLKKLSGQWHEVLTGICLVESCQHNIHSASSRSRVHFRRMSAEEIDWYLNTNEYRDKAGAYGIQGYAALFIDRIEGCYFNIVGFPVATFERLCRKAKIKFIPESILMT